MINRISNSRVKITELQVTKINEKNRITRYKKSKTRKNTYKELHNKQRIRYKSKTIKKQ